MPDRMPVRLSGRSSTARGRALVPAARNGDRVIAVLLSLVSLLCTFLLPHTTAGALVPLDSGSHSRSQAGSRSAARPVVLTPERFGAVGNGRADDTAALQRALDAVPRGGTLQLPAGKVFRHTAVLRARVAGEHVSGPGTLLATTPAASSFWITADNVTVDGGLTVRAADVTKRWDAFEQMGIRLAGVSGTVLRNVHVVGSAAAGVYVGQSCCTGPVTRSSHFLIDHVSVAGTRADGIHMTGGSYDGTVQDVTVSRTGDDGVAVVSYRNDGAPCHDISINSPTVATTLWGRGVSVVGGTDITYRNVHVDHSNAAAVYVADEGSPFYTYGVNGVRVLGAVLTHANTNPKIDHGAVFVFSSRAQFSVRNVAFSDVTIRDTTSTAPWQVGVGRSGGTLTSVSLDDVHIAGNLDPLATNVAGDDYRTLKWTVNGKPRPDHD